MTAERHAPARLLPRRPARPGQAARRLHGARLRGPARSGSIARSAGSSGSSTGCRGVRADEEMGWKMYALAMLLFNVAGPPARLPPPAPAGRAAAEPAGLRRGVAGLLVQHRGELRHQHELAGLRRRDDDELSHPDARAHRAELRLGRDRHGRPGRAHPRLRAALGRRPSATSGSISRGPRSTSCCRCPSSRPRPRVPGRRADVRGVSEGDRGPAHELRRARDGQGRQAACSTRRASRRRRSRRSPSRSSRSGRPPRRSRSSSSAPTAAASST